MKILYVGDEVEGRPTLTAALRAQGHTPHVLRGLADIERALDEDRFGVLVLDWEVVGTTAPEVFAAAHERRLPTIVLTRELSNVGRYRRDGVTCLVKPFPMHALEEALQVAAARGLAACPENTRVQSRNPVMNRLLQLAWRAAETDATVLLLGESGTGKSALAAEIHQRSARRERPFVTVHCPCLHPQLLESQLFGHVQGAFTGAVSDSLGRAAAAEGGTLFLDEVGDLPLELQPKLLRLLQDHEFERVGDYRTQRVDIRVVAATHRDLAAEVTAGRFREDLYYRLNVVSLRMVPLRRRPEDIVPAAHAFLAQLGTGARRELLGFTASAQSMLQNHGWPGNLRELRNAVERAAILARGQMIDRNDLLLDGDSRSRPPVPLVGELVTLTELEDAHIREVLSRVGNYRQAARILGINKSTLYRKLRSGVSPSSELALPAG